MLLLQFVYGTYSSINGQRSKYMSAVGKRSHENGENSFQNVLKIHVKICTVKVIEETSSFKS